ncbi:MAG: aromatic amino acid hydroxylase [Chitinophagaceae bacterium]|nr:aromatic amino acid hydroxylase [Oligoflexus sp.]
MTRTIDKLPSHLRPYCSEHDYSKYTSRDQAAWRYIMRRSQDFFKDHAVASYQSGFAKSGLTVDRIPHIDAIDKAMQDVGWGAVPVVGFIAPWAFIEFQARKIIPIATDMRTVDHIAYTPAPDIVHEAAGHAPIIPDTEYSDYLAYYASLGTKALYSKEDLMVYEAVRYLSDIKEKPESTPSVIAAAEKRLQDVNKSFSFVSEQTLVARMSWWTAEYGLSGSVKNPKIYGAGLLSSVGESKYAMTERVKKIPFSIDCIKYTYNITEPQPQLFVAEDMQHLTSVLHELDALLAFKRGGHESLQKAKDSRAIATVVLDTAACISGVLADFERTGDRIDFVKFSGPVQLGYEGKQLPGHGLERHGEGFSTPIGRLAARPDSPLSTMDDTTLRSLGIEKGQISTLSFSSGIEVKGLLTQVLRKAGKIVLLTFKDCTVKKGSKIYFEPSWGEFDMLVGDQVPSVYGGPADREAFGEHEISEPETTPSRESPFSAFEKSNFVRYEKLRDLRTALHQQPGEIKALKELEAMGLETYAEAKDEWLLMMEIYELGREQKLDASWMKPIKDELDKKKSGSDNDVAELVSEGLRLIN